MSAYVLGVDIGTTAIKAAIFDIDGREVSSHTEEYALHTPRAGHVELDAATYTQTFTRAVRRAVQTSAVPADELRAIGLSAQGETMLCLDANNEPLRQVIVWMDNRAAAEAAELERHFRRAKVHATTGQPSFDAIWPASKVLWLKRNEPETFAKTAKFVLLKDYLVYQLTGSLVSEDSLLCTTMFWDINTREYWPEMLDYLGITTDHMPEIARQGEVVGTLSAALASELGISQGIPVSVGALDQACGALGVGNVDPGTFSESTGSALASVTVVDDLTLDPAAQVPCFAAAVPGKYLLHNFSTGGMVMRWYRDQFCSAERQIEELCDINAYALIDREVQSVDAGCDGLVVLPHLQGSGPPDYDPYAKGVIFGLTLAHTKRHLSRAIMEGVTMVLRRMIDSTKQLGAEVSEVISLSGGSKSDAWCQIKADATQLPVRTLKGAESAGCRGAAILAGVAVGMWKSHAEIARRTLQFDREFKPDPGNAQTYDRLFANYVRLQNTLQPMFVNDRV
ncbi:xylulokinase [Mycolicibacterium goodii]|uniref:xylulokinase n=1 Tax=Mycolicibacterium goodii TaxID=134601 RepID=UPI000C2657B7|nr:FGGY family carbohydrate kinase [Mycolicibacterium goodii]PJK20427.1 hypothetical protein CSX11_21020 [Mycolicibacterium goodii]